MRRMNTVATPGVYHHCRALLQRRVELASVSGPCTQQCSAPLVYPSCASGYHRRAPSQLLHLHSRSGPALRCGRTLRTLVSSAAATESEGLETYSLLNHWTNGLLETLTQATKVPPQSPHSRRSCICKNFPAQEFRCSWY